VARPRVIIASPEAGVTVRLVASLNPKRYRIEHLHDASEALLRAEFVIAHAVVLHVSELDDQLRRRLESARVHGVGLVLVGDSDEVEKLADEVDAHHLRTTFTVPEVKRRVLDAVSDAHLERSSEPSLPSRRDMRTVVRRVLLVLEEREAAEVMAALIRGQLSVACDVACSIDAALDDLERGFDCVVSRPGQLLGSAAGAELARKLARRGIPVVPIPAAEELEASTAGQLAWSLVPQIRRTLTARERRAADGTPR
jgi:hypothetical protein